MSLRIDEIRIRPPAGTAGTSVSVKGNLHETTKIIWGEHEFTERDWFQEDYSEDHTELDFEVPDGEGTVQVVAVNGNERSNVMEFTYA